MKYYFLSITKIPLILTCLFMFFASKGMSQQYKMLVSKGGSVSVNDGVFNFKNTSLITNGQFTGNKGSNLIFSGKEASQLSGAVAIYADTLSVNKLAEGNILLENKLFIKGNLVFTTGKLNLMNQTIYLDSNALIVNECRQNYLTGNTHGSIQINKMLPQNFAQNIANLGMVLNSYSSSGSVAIQRAHYTIKQIKSINRVYTIINTENNVKETLSSLKLLYFDSELNGNDENVLSVWFSKDGIQWTDIGYDKKDMENNYLQLNNTLLSGMFTIAPQQLFNRLQLYPNPVINTTVLSISIKENCTGKIWLVDGKGQTVFAQDKVMRKGLNIITVNLAKYPAGVYNLLLQTPHFSANNTLIKL